VDLLSTLQAVRSGSQAGDNIAAQQGMVPSASRPVGSPQLYLQASGALRGQIANLNSLYDSLFRQAGTDDALQAAVRDLIGTIHKLQSIATTLDARAKELASQQPMSQPMM